MCLLCVGMGLFVMHVCMHMHAAVCISATVCIGLEYVFVSMCVSAWYCECVCVSLMNVLFLMSSFHLFSQLQFRRCDCHVCIELY